MILIYIIHIFTLYIILTLILTHNVLALILKMDNCFFMIFYCLFFSMFFQFFTFLHHVSFRFLLLITLKNISLKNSGSSGLNLMNSQISSLPVAFCLLTSKSISPFVCPFTSYSIESF